MRSACQSVLLGAARRASPTSVVALGSELRPLLASAFGTNIQRHLAFLLHKIPHVHRRHRRRHRHGLGQWRRCEVARLRSRRGRRVGMQAAESRRERGQAAISSAAQRGELDFQHLCLGLQAPLQRMGERRGSGGGGVRVGGVVWLEGPGVPGAG